MELALRVARERDIPALAALIPLSVRALQAATYTAAQMDAAIGPVFGVSGGLHAFVTERVSFDAALSFDYALAFARNKVTGNPDMNMNQKTDFERSARLPNLAFVVGMSVWLGRDRSDRDRRDDDRISTRR